MTRRAKPSAAALTQSAKRWLEQLGSTPAEVAHAVELLVLGERDELIERLLSAVEAPSTAHGHPPLTRTRTAPLPWQLPLDGPRSVERIGYGPHAAAALALATRSDGPSAQRIRRARHLELTARPASWTLDGFERFTELQSLQLWHWHPEAPLPDRLLALPHATRVFLNRVPVGHADPARIAWQLPKVKVLIVHRCNLTTLPEALRGSLDLEELSLAEPNLRELPTWLADLPRLRSLGLGQRPPCEVPPVVAQAVEANRRAAQPAWITRPRPASKT